MSTDTSEKAGRYSSCAHSCAVCGDADMLHLTDLERENLHLEAELRKLRDALEEYGQHGPSCMAGIFEPRPNGTEPWVPRGPCDCGLDEALAGGAR